MGKNGKKIILLLMVFTSIIGEWVVAFAEKDVYYETSVAEKDKVNFNNLTMKDGLSNNYIEEIYQDSKGYIWIGTKDGLNRYDGSTITQYSYESDNENSLSSNHITSIIEDSHGNIWVGTYGGLNIIEKDTNKVFRASNYTTLDRSLSNYCVITLYRDKSNNMWIGTSNGLNMYDEMSGNFITYYAEDNEYSLTDNYITDIEEDDNGFLWVSTAKGIATIEIKTGKIYNDRYKYDNDKYIYGVSKDNNGNMWILGEEGIKKKDLVNNLLGSHNIKLSEYMKNDISYILCDSSDNVWLASSNGLIKYIPKDKITKIYKSDVNSPKYLLSDTITCLYEDRNGVLWVGTDSGVSILNVGQQFSNRINNILRNNGLSGSSITTILEDSNNNLWVGTKQNGIVCFIIDTGEVIRYVYDEFDDNSLLSNTINNIIEGNDNKIIVSTDKGVLTIDKDIGKVNIYEEEIYKSTSFNECTKILKDGEYFWVATKDGFYRSDAANYERVDYKEEFKEAGIKNYTIFDVFQDENDADILWLGSGTYGGLIKFHKKDGVIKNYLSGSGRNSLSYDVINCIEGDGKGNLWIGTGSGLNRFNIEDETFTNYSKESGLPSNYIDSILIDDNGDIWLGTSNGLSKFSIEENRFINFTESDGLYGSQFNKGAAFKTSSGRLLFGTTNGVVSLDPKNIEKTLTDENDVVLGDVWINKKLVVPENDMKLKYNQNNIVFKYFLPDYSQIGDVTYIYRLDGFDRNWNYTHALTYSSYTSLSLGEYSFRVKAIKSDGSVTDEFRLNFEIKNPFWLTKTAWFIYFIFSVAIILYIIKHVKILKALVEKQTKEINNQMEENKLLYERSIENERFKNDYFVNLSHELRTPINIILSVLQVMNSLDSNNNMTKEKNTKYMDIIKKSSNNLLKIIGDIIDSSKIESGAYKINKQDNIDIVYLVEETALNMSEYIKENGIELIVDPEIEEKLISCDPKEIERCIINLIGNSVKFTEKGGEIKVLIKDNKDSVSVSIEDNGLGISKDDQEFIFNRFEQGKNFNSTKVSSSGIGLTLVKYIVELHNGRVSLESEENKGSKFTITLPIE